MFNLSTSGFQFRLILIDFHALRIQTLPMNRSQDWLILLSPFVCEWTKQRTNWMSIFQIELIDWVSTESGIWNRHPIDGGGETYDENDLSLYPIQIPTTILQRFIENLLDFYSQSGFIKMNGIKGWVRNSPGLCMQIGNFCFIYVSHDIPKIENLGILRIYRYLKCKTRSQNHF